MNKEQFTFYIDESCHLEHDHFPVMCIGYIKVPKEQTEEMKQCIKAIKRGHNILHEIKWNTISNTHIDMYKELIDYFFDSNMEFRCILVKYKDRLDNLSFNNGEHDNFYYKMANGPLEDAIQLAEETWQMVNLVNLREYIAPTKERASLILHKTDGHLIDRIYLRHI